MSRAALPLLLLLIGATRHYLWPLWPAELRGVASKMLGACAAICLLSIISSMAPQSVWIQRVVTWYAIEEGMAAGCSGAYLIEPWPIPEGASMCSALVGFDLGAAGILVVAVLACLIPVRPNSIEKRPKA